MIDRTGIYNVDGAFLAGGMRVGYYPHGYSVSRNLTSDTETGLGQWSVPQIVRALRNGQAPDRALNPFAMLWAQFPQLHRRRRDGNRDLPQERIAGGV